MNKSKTCEDCGEDVEYPQRRIRCKNCNALVCSWCFHHAHKVFQEIAKQAKKTKKARK